MGTEHEAEFGQHVLIRDCRRSETDAYFKVCWKVSRFAALPCVRLNEGGRAVYISQIGGGSPSRRGTEPRGVKNRKKPNTEPEAGAGQRSAALGRAVKGRGGEGRRRRRARPVLVLLLLPVWGGVGVCI